jgi:hypothetical protein
MQIGVFELFKERVGWGGVQVVGVLNIHEALNSSPRTAKKIQKFKK